MAKLKIRADDIKAIVLGLFNGDEINSTIEEGEWAGQTLMDVLNCHYFAFKHRAVTTDDLIAEIRKTSKSDIDYLMALRRGFCSVVLQDTTRLFHKEMDQLTINGLLRYWISPAVVPVLEELVENANIALSGVRVAVDFKHGLATTTRKAIVVFSNVTVSEVQTDTPCGEMAIANVSFEILLNPESASYSDFEVSINDTLIEVRSFDWAVTMAQKSVPIVGNVTNVGSMNLSRAKSFVLTFDGLTNNAFINELVAWSLANDESSDNNRVFKLSIKRGDATFDHDVIIREHQVRNVADTSNETHTLSLVSTGVYK